MIDKQPEIAIAMRGCMDASLDFFESYLRSRDYVLTNRGEGLSFYSTGIT